jgi:hypothetical protein
MQHEIALDHCMTLHGRLWFYLENYINFLMDQEMTTKQMCGEPKVLSYSTKWGEVTKDRWSKNCGEYAKSILGFIYKLNLFFVMNMARIYL